jgi:hypothetical protein
MDHPQPGRVASLLGRAFPEEVRCRSNPATVPFRVRRPA